jgi:hypothetical protein
MIINLLIYDFWSTVYGELSSFFLNLNNCSKITIFKDL